MKSEPVGAERTSTKCPKCGSHVRFINLPKCWGDAQHSWHKAEAAPEISEPVGASLSAQTPPELQDRARSFINGIFADQKKFNDFFNSLPSPCSKEDRESALMAMFAQSVSSGAAQEEALRSDDEKAMMEVLTERDEAQEWADNLAYAVGEYFDIDVGEHSSCSDPRVEAMKILKGEYVTKFDKPAQKEAPSPTEFSIGIEAINFCLSCLRAGCTADEILAAWPPKYRKSGVVAEEEAGVPAEQAQSGEFVPAFENPCVDLRHGHGEVKVPWNNRDDEPQEPK